MDYLSGTGSDGSVGLADMKPEGGVTIAPQICSTPRILPATSSD
jgi:chemotaxis response regulator CheB